MIKNLPALQKTWRRCRFNPWVGKIPWRRKWRPAPVFSPRNPLGQRSLWGYRPWSHRVGYHCVAKLQQYAFNKWKFRTSRMLGWRRKWQPLCILPWGIPWTEEPGGLLPMGSHRVRHDWSELACMHVCMLGTRVGSGNKRMNKLQSQPLGCGQCQHGRRGIKKTDLDLMSFPSFDSTLG